MAGQDYSQALFKVEEVKIKRQERHDRFNFIAGATFMFSIMLLAIVAF